MKDSLEDEPPCLRCGCPIRKGEHRAYVFLKSSFRPVSNPMVIWGTGLQAHEIDQHLRPDDCMVALRRKEVGE